MVRDQAYIRCDGTEYVKMTVGMTVVTPTPRPIKPVNTKVMATRDGVTKASRPQNKEINKRDEVRMIR